MLKRLENQKAGKDENEGIKMQQPPEPKSIRKVVFDSEIEKRRRADGSIRPLNEQELEERGDAYMDDYFGGPFAALRKFFKKQKKRREADALERAMGRADSTEQREARNRNWPPTDYAWRRFRGDVQFLQEFKEYEEKKKFALKLFTDDDEYEEFLPYNSLGVDWNGVEYNQTSQQVMPRDDWIPGKMKSPAEHATAADPMHVKILNY